MSEKDIQDHHRLLKETGKFCLTKDQNDTINKLLDGVVFELEEDHEPTLDLPILGRRK